MRTLFILLGGMSLLGAVMDAALAALLGLVVMTGYADRGASAAASFADHWPALASVAGSAWRLGFEPAALWIFVLPALLYFPVRIILGLLTGVAALAASRGTLRS